MSDGENPVTVRYRNVSGHPEDLSDGRVVGSTGDESFVELTDEDVKDEFNKSKIEQGTFVEAPEPDVKEPTLDELKDEARELKITGFSSMNKDELTQAIATAKVAAESEGGTD